jgi:acetolactate synthase I/II/III large subunit
MTKLSDYVMRFLVEKGVKDVFMLTGGGAMHLNDSIGRCEELNYCCFLHEQAISIATDAYGQHTNFPGVAMVTSGPGGTNAVTGVAASYIDSTPCLYISGQAKRSDLKGDSGVRQMGAQEVDIVSIIQPVTKYAVCVLDPLEIQYHLERAWHEATTGRMGPVWVDIPMDVQGAIIDETALKTFEPEAEAKTENPIEQVKAILATAERPAVLVGNGVKLDGATETVRAFVAKNRIPVLLTWKMVDFMGYDDPLNYGHPGIMGSRYANFIAQNCDVMLVLGSRLDPSLTAFNSRDFARNAKKIMVDIDRAEINKIEGVDISVEAPISNFMDGVKELNTSTSDEWIAYCSRLREKYPAVEYRAPDPDAVDLYRFVVELSRQMKASDVVVPESSGAAGEVTYQAIQAKRGQSIKNAAGLGAMGFGLPYAIGSCIAMDKRRTILINGDGALQLNIQEFETLRRLDLPVKIFVLENGGYASIMATQTKLFDGFLVGANAESGLTVPDIVHVARGYRLKTATIATDADLESGIAEVLNEDGPVVCSVRVRLDQETIPKVQSIRLPDGKMKSGALDNMWPTLAEEEIAASKWDFDE